MRALLVGSILIVMNAAFCAQEAPPAMQVKLMGHWKAEKEHKLQIYYSLHHRILENDVPNEDAGLALMDYYVWEVWQDLRTIIIAVGDNGVNDTLLVITLSEDEQSAICREKTAKGWTRSYRIIRVDNITQPKKLPEKLRLLDLDHGVGGK